MNLYEEKIEFDLSALNLKELVEVYEDITEFIDFLKDNKIILEEKEAWIIS